MSGVAFNCVTPEVTVTGGNTDTVIGIAAAANHRVHIKKIKISFKGVTVTAEPVTIKMTRWSSDGTGTAGTVVKVNSSDNETVEASFKHTYTAEPTTPTTVDSFAIHPQGGVWETLPIEAPIPIGGGEFVGLELSPDSGEDSVVIVTIWCEE
jgi:hypothetical protein